MKKKIELLAPAGSFQVMKACFSAGADAVYMGLSRFSARAFAENADKDDYVQAIDYAHLHGKKLYLTLNTLLKEQELENEVRPLLQPLYEAGLDGIIVQDLGLMRVLYRNFPDLPLHVSTQAAVTDPYHANLLKKLGAVRVVPARELSLREIRRIREESGLQVECFIHGALCYSYSGQCLFSSLVGGRSGNRGRCAQSCRMPYTLFDEKGQRLNKKGEEYLLSLRDLNTLQFLPELFSAGVDSLKIEGRMKKAEYAAGVTSVYRKYLDLLLEIHEKTGEESPEELRKAGYAVDPADEKTLFLLFNRNGFTDGYLRRHNGREMLSLREPAFREEPQVLTETIRRNYIDTPHRSPARLNYRFEEGKPGMLRISTVLDGRHFFCEVFSDFIAERAGSRPAQKEDAEKQLLRLGDSDFAAESIEGVIEGSLFLPVSALNALRRKAVSALNEKILLSYRRKTQKPGIKPQEQLREKPLRYPAYGYAPQADESGKTFSVRLQILVSKRQQLYPALRSSADTIILESTFSEAEEYEEIAENIRAHGKKAFLALPPVFRKEMQDWLNRNREPIRNAGFDGFLIRSLGELSWLDENAFPGRRTADHSLYAMNHETQEFLRECGFSRLTVPLELSEPEIRNMDFSGDTILLYGYLPMMLSANCLLRTASGCDRKNRTLMLSDRMGNRLPAECICRYCLNRILNAVPLSLLSLAPDVRKLGIPEGRLDFTVESEEETGKLIRAFERAYISGEKTEELPLFTRGHFRRKVD